MAEHDVDTAPWGPPYRDEPVVPPRVQFTQANREWGEWVASLDPSARAAPTVDPRILAKGPKHRRRRTWLMASAIAVVVTVVATVVVVKATSESTPRAASTAPDDNIDDVIPGASRFVSPDGTWSVAFVGQPTTGTRSVLGETVRAYLGLGPEGDGMSAVELGKGHMADLDVIEFLKSGGMGLSDVQATPTVVFGQHAVKFTGKSLTGIAFKDHGLEVEHGGKLLMFIYQDFADDDPAAAEAFIASVRLL